MGGSLPARVSQQLTSQDSHSCSSVTHFLELGLRDLDQDLSGRVIDMHRFQDRGTVVCHCDVSLLWTSPDWLEDFILLKCFL